MRVKIFTIRKLLIFIGRGGSTSKGFLTGLFIMPTAVVLTLLAPSLVFGNSIGRLTVSVEPSDARIRIMNIEPRYEDGIELKLGEEYDIYVTRSGYQSYRETLLLTEPEQTIDITLIKKILNKNSLKDALGPPQPNSLSAKFDNGYYDCLDDGDLDACNFVAHRYRAGTGNVERDRARAASIFNYTCNAGSGSGCSNYAIDMKSGSGGVRRDKAGAAALFRKGCDLGSIGGCEKLAKMYENGEGVPTDKAQAFELYNFACKADTKRLKIFREAACINAKRLRGNR